MGTSARPLQPLFLPTAFPGRSRRPAEGGRDEDNPLGLKEQVAGCADEQGAYKVELGRWGPPKDGGRINRRQDRRGPCFPVSSKHCSTFSILPDDAASRDTGRLLFSPLLAPWPPPFPPLFSLLSRGAGRALGSSRGCQRRRRLRAAISLVRVCGLVGRPPFSISKW